LSLPTSKCPHSELVFNSVEMLAQMLASTTNVRLVFRRNYTNSGIMPTKRMPVIGLCY